MRGQLWLSAFRRYFAAVTCLHLLWEIVQLPLYTIWHTGSTKSIAFAILHCTGGDVVVAITALVSALVLLGSHDWPASRRFFVGALAVTIGVVYTVFSERVNVARGAWTYSDLMPIVPWIDVGLAPVLQWLVIPSVGLWITYRRDRKSGLGDDGAQNGRD